MSTSNKTNTFKRLSVNLPPELDKAVLDLRKTDKYCRCSYADIIRILMAEGARVLSGDTPNNTRSSA